MTAWHVAQVNVARLLQPVESPKTQEFISLLDPVNALADDTRGFVWRLSATSSMEPTDADPMIVVNLSVWETIEHLEAFVRLPAHADVMRRRREWFERMAEAYMALWWVPAGTVPTEADAFERIELIRALGPSEKAFTFRQRFPAPG
jgi:heme-degrading monooxygenase HmoA